MSSKGLLSLDESNASLRAFFEEHPEAEPAFMRRYMMSWIYHDNALDGLVLTEEEITLALEHHVVADPSIMTVLNTVRSHRKAFARIEEEAKSRRGKITVPLLRTLYEFFLETGHPTEKEKAVMRMEMPLHRVYLHDFVQPEEIEGGLETWAKKLASSEFKEQHPVRQAANAHWHLMQIFPFAEHNGRIARLVQNFFLLRAGYLPPVIHARERQGYYQSLRHSPSSLRKLLIEAMETSMESSLRFLRSEETKRAG